MGNLVSNNLVLKQKEILEHRRLLSASTRENHQNSDDSQNTKSSFHSSPSSSNEEDDDESAKTKTLSQRESEVSNQFFPLREPRFDDSKKLSMTQRRGTEDLIFQK
jgi:hypothetical protein